MKLSEITPCLDCDSYAFGPAVRRDIKSGGGTLPDGGRVDLVTLDKESRDQIVRNLQAQGFQVSKNATYRATTYRRSSYDISKGGKRSSLSIFMPMNDGIYHEDVVNAMFNADVDRLMADQNGEYLSAGDASLNEAIRNIRRGKCNIDGVISENEKLDLLSNGFTLGASEDAVQENKKVMKPQINNKEIGKMANKSDFWGMAKDDAEKAAYRIASTQITNGTKAAILAIMEKQGNSNDTIKAVSSMLDTEFGSAMIAMMIGMGLTYAPKISDDARVQKLAGEFRVDGMARAGNALFEVATEHFLPVVMNAISALPEPEKARIEAPAEHKQETDEDEEDEQEEATPLRKMTA